MSWWLKVRRRRTLDKDLAEELAFHKDMRSNDAAPPPFGNDTVIRERVRELWSLGWVESAFHDAVFAVRGWRRNPAFAATIIASLALGIGAVIAIFSAADALLFRPLPFREPGKLVMIWEANRAAPENQRNPVSPDNFLDWKLRNTVFEDMAYVDEGRSVFSAAGRSEELRVQRVPPNFFALLGARPLLGAAVTDASPVVISYRLWQNWFGGDPGIVGRKVELDSFPQTVSAVMPPGFAFGDRNVDLWPFLQIQPSARNDRGARTMRAVARLKPGVSLARAQEQMYAIAGQLAAEDPRFNKNWTVRLESLQDAFTHPVKTSLLVLLAAVSLLLLVACANAANLLLGRCSARRAEMAMRAALGAGRWRLTRQLLCESLLIAVAAGAAGLVSGRYALTALIAIAPNVLTQTADVFMNWRIALFAVALSAVTGILFGLAPSWIGARAGTVGSANSAGSGRSTAAHSLRAWLIASEIAVSVVLLAAGSLLFRSLIKLEDVDSGLQPRNLLTFHFRVLSPHDVVRFAQAVDGIEKLPGVVSASATSFLPFGEPAAVTPVSITGRAPAKPGEELAATVRTVMPGYFSTMGIPLRAGRDFTAADNTPQAPLSFVVNQAFVRGYLRGANPLTSSIRVSMARNNPPGRILGVVADVREGSLGNPPVPTVYYVYAHMTYGQMNLVVRTERDPATITEGVRRVVRDLDPKLAVADMQTMETILGATYAREHFLAVLMGCFSVCALFLAAVGIYGILAYSVSSRTQEIGIRQAIGASSGQILRMVLAEGAWCVGGGLAAGVAGAAAVTRLLSGLLYQTSASDPVAFALALGILLSVALLAAYIPARRAARLDPMRALRFE